MPQAAQPTWSTARMDQENDFTEAALEAHELFDLAESVRAWAPIVETLRPKNRAQRRRQARLEAKRQVVNRGLDKLVKKAGLRLDGQLERDHDHPD